MDTRAKWITNGNMWQHPHAVKDALCFDGRRRTVRLNVQPVTRFAWSGRTKIKGKSVRGYVVIDTPGDAEFRLFDSEWEKLGIDTPGDAEFRLFDSEWEKLGIEKL